ncbi:uncharacterized protein LOC116215548 isoform X1 [Punica granatum]|uniref:Uncharacterized protein LOC116215548 isoform X1 n=1 Tax=Punica granatum TaxID=22663 RepID=A0A6P8EAX0_PUNGR|nr:uncharacterized protein LOC116215548 isoform X1 [Punica granatum]
MLGIILYLHEMVEVVVLVKGVNKKSVLSEPGTLLLKVMFKPSGRSCYSVALDGLLWACRPTTVFLTASYPFVKFICTALANGEEDAECSQGDVNCWKHEDKGLTIERVEGLQHPRPLDGSIFSSWARKLRFDAGNEVCLRLQC